MKWVDFKGISNAWHQKDKKKAPKAMKMAFPKEGWKNCMTKSFLKLYAVQRISEEMTHFLLISRTISFIKETIIPAIVVLLPDEGRPDV